jgi:AraC-like DNA-binding protein
VAHRPASGLIVQAVARRWGWASHSRFTVAYQQQFGVLPSYTLRS